MREFLKSFFSFGVATSIQKLLGFLLLPLYTRFFTTVEFGVIDLIQVILGITSIFAILQLETSFQRYYFELKGELKDTFVSSIFIVTISLSFLLTGILNVFSLELSTLIFDTAKYSQLIEIASYQLPFTNFSMLAFVLLRYEKKNKIFFFMVLTKVITLLAAVYILVVWLDLGLKGVFYSQLISLLISSLLIFICVKKYLLFQISVPLFRKALRYALPQIPARIGSVSLLYANRFFMISFLTVSSIGIFSFSLKLASVMQLLYTAFIMAWAPFMFEHFNEPGHKKMFSKVLLLVSCPIFLLVSLISLFSYELVAIVGTQDYTNSYHYIGGLSLYFALFIIKEIVDIGPKVLEKTKYISYTFFVSVIVNLLSLYFFINLYGLIGVVFSLIITNTFLVVFSWYISNRLYFIPFGKIKFLATALPAFFLAIYSMFELPSFMVRTIISLFLFLFYGVFFLKHYNVNQNIYNLRLKFRN